MGLNAPELRFVQQAQFIQGQRPVIPKLPIFIWLEDIQYERGNSLIIKMYIADYMIIR